MENKINKNIKTIRSNAAYHNNHDLINIMENAQPLELKKLDMLYTMKRIDEKLKMKNKIAIRKNVKIKRILKHIALGGILWSVASAIYAVNSSL
jgi:hypothetical protein